MRKYNQHECIRFIVQLTFVAPDEQHGYQRDGVSHKETAEEAIFEVLKDHLNETYPLKGISVYECVLSA
jgi:hypothetical protein